MKAELKPLADRIVTLAAELARAPIEDLNEIHLDLMQHGTDHEDALVDIVTTAVLRAAIDERE